ncbi:2-dehydro-3-deoxyphosphogluconate aldolase [Bacillus sp. SA1-12]|uniref:bifunctional 4-hydroxy-2-oxoglutarate aldolase/2-dehydro-3-deoxy-phosphogluconate aldolase n=1 Tax=Bacillus sp. SA1-12 TaxID=1455638 RepID=UPI0006250D1D|nr:bifunctional 4-hydroxy-2-oxoglutarate aldolase/2-dehydro-3-deoxy-phosphogluconate aldolase [Bacillus sp. SA1-12]KKI92780.1 2-dehydro-3-deoxyphosphogluconate aldolase [Bacillus sp. SA1-12]
MNTLENILESKLIAIIRNANPEDVLPIVESLYKGGIFAIEITMNSPKALWAIEQIAEKWKGQVVVGAGTVLDSETARMAISAGASFILSPTVNKDTIQLTKRYGVISIPGAFTPTEILQAYQHGGDIIKVFPASFGTAYIKDIKGPLPHIPLLPTGGVNLENVRDFIDAGAVGVGIGSTLVNSKQAVTEDYLRQLEQKSKRFYDLVHSYGKE